MKFDINVDIYKISFLYDNNILVIKINVKNDKSKIFKRIQIKFGENNESNLNYDEFTKLINLSKPDTNTCPCNDSIRIYQKEGKKYLSISLNNNENNPKRIEKEIEQLNVKYYLTIGIDNKRINETPFYSYLDKEIFNLADIKKLLEKENLDKTYDFDSFRMKNQYGFYEKIGYNNCKINNSLLELELHCNYIKDNSLLTQIKTDEPYTNKIIDLKERLNKYSQNVTNYDLIYLYASPIVKSINEEDDRPISYREEIEIIINAMNKKKKKFNCLFECISYDVLKDILTNKKTKILHISSHGSLKNKDNKIGDNTEYSLVLEYLNNSGNYDNNFPYGDRQMINEEKLRNLLTLLSNKIKNIHGIILSTCHSGGFAELFFEHKPQNIIYVDKKTEIGDYTSVKFTKYFYEEFLEGTPIEQCYKIALEKLKCDTDILHYKVDRCCCFHFHSNRCQFKDTKPEILLKSEFHKKYHVKSEKCKCENEECHIHDDKCVLAKEAKEAQEKALEEANEKDQKKALKEALKEVQKEAEKEALEKNLIIEEVDGKIKICCCDINISHNEIAKFKFKSFADENNKEKSKEINIFKYNINGKININENVCTYFDAQKKYYSIIGRKVLLRDLFKFISIHNNDNFFIILYGQKGLHKRIFTESTCVHLFERKIIHYFEIFIIKQEMDCDYNKMKEKIQNNRNPYSHDKTVLIIKFLSMEKLEHLQKNIDKLEKDFSNYNNLYFILLYDYNLDKKEIKEIEKIDEDKIEKYKCFNANIKEPLLLLKYYLRFYNDSCKLDSQKDLSDALIGMKPIPKQIERIAISIISGRTVEEIIDMINKKSTNLLYEVDEVNFQEEKIEIYSQYYLLLKLPRGLPNSFLSLIFCGYEKNSNTNNELFININTKNDWKYVNKNIIFKKDEKNVDILPYAKTYIAKALKLYTIFLDYFIDKNRNEVYFKDTNIHIIFNSYNDTETWKNNVKELTKNKTFDRNIFMDKNYNIMMHKDNILSLISLIISNLEVFLSEDEKIEEYIEEILLLYPSAFFFKKFCKEILQNCKFFCDNCIKYFKKDIKYTQTLKKFKRLRNKLLLFQYSIGEIEKLEEKDLTEPEEDLKLELFFLNFLFSKTSHSNYEDGLKESVKSGKVKNKKKISLSHYECAKIHFSKKNYKNSKKYLKNAIKYLIYYILGIREEPKETDKISDSLREFFDKWLNKEIDTDKFNLEIKYLFRMIIDLSQVFKLGINPCDPKLDSKIEKKINILDKILLDNIDNQLYNKANLLRTELFCLQQPDIVMLNANPIKNRFSLLSNGIYSILNNQYHILKQLSDDKKKDKNKEIESYIRIKSNILNFDNLKLALNKKGEILILQSDDFSDNGDLFLEIKEGESELLPRNCLLELLQKKKDIEYKVIILCFNNSSKLMETIINDSIINCEYIISFEYFHENYVNKKTLIEYNKLCIEFIIDFIKISSKYNNIVNIFEKAKNKFLENKNNKCNQNLDVIPGREFIYLTKNKKDSVNQIEYNQEKSEVYLYEELPIIYDNYENKSYFFEMNDIINEINTNGYKIKYCCVQKRERFIKIGIEIIKYFYRHQSFVKYYDIDMKKVSIDKFKKIIKESQKNIKKENKKDNTEEKKQNFYLIYNCYEEKSIDITLDNIIFNKDSYFIIYDFVHESGDCNSEISSDSESMELIDYSIFSRDKNDEIDMSDESDN